MDDQDYVPFGEDYSYRDFLLRMFKGGEESPEIEEDYSYHDFLHRMFEGGEESTEIKEEEIMDCMFEGGEESTEIKEEEIMDEPSEELKDTCSDSKVDANIQTKPIEDFESLAKPRRHKYALTYTIVASMISLLLGYDIGVMSNVEVYMGDQSITEENVEFSMGITKVISLLGSAMAGWTCNRIGHRLTIILAGAFFFIGYLLMAISTIHFYLLLLGRLFVNIGVGYALMIAPVYVAEISPAFSRGFLTSLPEAFINLGTLLGYISHYAFARFSQDLGLWRLILYVAAIPLVLLTFGVLFMPESPRWLIMHGRLGDAKRILARISDFEEEATLRLAEIKEAAGIPEACNDDVVKVTKQSTGEGRWRSSSVYHMLLCAVGMHFFQQASGIDTILLYSPRIFEKAGITSYNAKYLMTIVVDFVKTMFVLIATFLLDRAGRRPLLLSSIGGMIFSLASLGMCLTVIDHSHAKVKWAMAMCITSVLSYVAFFSIGMGPITLLYSSEIFPLRLRVQGCAIGIAVNQVVSGLLSMKFILVYRAITFGGVAFMFSAIASVAWLYFYMLMPETKGRTLEEMGHLFGKYTQWRSTARETEMKRNNDATETATRGNNA